MAVLEWHWILVETVTDVLIHFHSLLFRWEKTRSNGKSMISEYYNRCIGMLMQWVTTSQKFQRFELMQTKNYKILKTTAEVLHAEKLL